MYSNNRNESGAAWARGFMALCAVLAMGLGLMARPAEAAPFAYVTNDGADTVSVIDTATNTVVATVPVGIAPRGRRHPGWETRLCHESSSSSTVSVIDTATNTVVATIPVGIDPFGVAVTPDGKHAYVANGSSTTPFR